MNGALREVGTVLAKQASACLFGVLMILLLVGTWALWPADARIARYDLIFLGALAIQAALLASGLETWEEARVILVFHVVGTAMEIFKTHVGSWIYPEDSFFRIGGVPLFTGFMYSAIGSCIARNWRLTDMRFTGYPPRIWTYLLCIAVYVNFFAHHFGPDLRYALFAAAALLWHRTLVYATFGTRRLRIPLLAIFMVIAMMIWGAENIGTYTGTWLYPNQHDGWELVSLSKIGSWFLLMLISWVLVTAIRAPDPEPLAATARGC